MGERCAAAEAPRMCETEGRVVNETGASEFVPPIGQMEAKMVLTDPVDLPTDNRLELAFLQRNPVRRQRRREARMEADFPIVPGEGGHSRGDLRILEVGEPPRQRSVAKSPLRLGPLVEHEERGPDSRVAFEVSNRVEAPVWATASATWLPGASETFWPTEVGQILVGLAAPVDIMG